MNVTFIYSDAARQKSAGMLDSRDLKLIPPRRVRRLEECSENVHPSRARTPPDTSMKPLTSLCLHGMALTNI